MQPPDFVINAAAVCHAICELKADDISEAMKKTDLISAILKDIFEKSEKEKIPPLFIAYQMAYEKIQAKKK